MKDASPPQNNDHQQETNDYLPRVTNNCKTQNPKIEVKYNGNNDSEEDVKSDKTKDNIQKRDASSKTQLRKSYKPSIKRTDFPIVKPDAIRHHDTVVKCTPSKVTHTTSLIRGVPQPACPTVRYTTGDGYLHSDSSSTLSSAWDIELDLETENSEQDKAPLAQFRRWHKDMKFCLIVLCLKFFKLTL